MAEKYIRIDPPGENEVVVRMSAAQADRAAKALLEVCGPVPPDARGLYDAVNALATAAWHGKSR